MTRSIWKFPLNRSDAQEVEMPRGAEILTAQMQRGDICLWAIVNQGTPERERRRIYIVGTGHLMPEEPVRYIATVQEMGGQLIWHIFERD